jgi:hypothetical protein
MISLRTPMVIFFDVHHSLVALSRVVPAKWARYELSFVVLTSYRLRCAPRRGEIGRPQCIL